MECDGKEVAFKLSENCVLKIVKGNITEWSVDGSSDAIVNPANERMLGDNGADGAIHDVAGPQLRAACYDVPEVLPGVRCPTGEARMTLGFNLPASHVVHTVGPVYNAEKNPKKLLESAYRNSLRVAKENNIQYIAFTAISCGIFRYPLDEAASIAISTVKEFGKDFKEVSNCGAFCYVQRCYIYNVGEQGKRVVTFATRPKLIHLVEDDQNWILQ